MLTNHTNHSRLRTAIGVVLAAAALLSAAEASAQITPDWVVRRAGVDGFFFGFRVPVYMVTDSQGAVYISNSTLRVLRTDIQTVKYAPDGTEVWSVTYDGPSEHADRGRGITIDSAGDILVLGQSEGAFLVIKYDASDGSIIWTMEHEPGGVADVPYALTTDDAGNIYVTGSTRPSGGDHQEDFYTYKMDSAGNILWTATYDGPGQFLVGNDIAVDLALDSNGDVFVTGPSNDVSGHPDFVTIKYRGSDGAQLWLDRYHLSDDMSVDLIIDSQDNVYVTGFSEGQSHRISTIKYRNSDGERLWVALDTPAAQNVATSLALDSQGDVYVAGRADPDTDESNRNDNAVVIRHRASDGAQVWMTLYGESAVGHFDSALDIVIDASDNIYISGETSSFGASADLLILQYDAATGLIVDQGTYDVPAEVAQGRTLALDSAQNVIVAGTTRADPSAFMDFLTLKYPGPGGPVLVEILPDSFTILKGLLLFGDLEDLFDSDDSRVVVGPSSFVPPSGPEPPVQIEIEATSMTDMPSELRFRYEGHVFMPDSKISTRQRTSLFNYVTQSYDELDNRLAASSDEVFEIVITTNPTDYVELGTGRMRALITYKAEGLSGFLFAIANLDQTVWTIAE